jgi:hypothetical protein
MEGLSEPRKVLPPRVHPRPTREQVQEAGGRLNLGGVPLKYEENTTFLGLKLDSMLWFTEHAQDVKRRMAGRKRALSALAARSTGATQEV